MDIVVPTSSFPRHEDDGSGRFVLDLSRALVRRGHRVHHVVPDERGESGHLELEPELWVRRVAFGPAFTRGLVMGQGIGANLRAAPWRILGLPGLMSALRRGIATEAARHRDVVILSHWLLPAGIAASGLRRAGGPRHVTVVHGGALQNLLALPGGRYFLRSWAEGCDAALYVSEDLRRRARARLGERAPKDEVSAMGVVAERFGPVSGQVEARRVLGILPEARLVLGLGRLLPLKGFDLLIEAAAGIDDLVVVIGGAGPESSRLAALAERHGVDLRLPGLLTPRQIGAWMDAADRLVVPSRFGPGRRSEGTPVVALEALARGLGVIGAANGGLIDLLGGRPACALFPVADRAALAELLRAVDRRPTEGRVVSENDAWDYTRISGVVERMLAAGRSTL